MKYGDHIIVDGMTPPVVHVVRVDTGAEPKIDSGLILTFCEEVLDGLDVSMVPVEQRISCLECETAFSLWQQELQQQLGAGISLAELLEPGGIEEPRDICRYCAIRLSGAERARGLMCDACWETGALRGQPGSTAGVWQKCQWCGLKEVVQAGMYCQECESKRVSKPVAPCKVSQTREDKQRQEIEDQWKNFNAKGSPKVAEPKALVVGGVSGDAPKSAWFSVSGERFVVCRRSVPPHAKVHETRYANRDIGCQVAWCGLRWDQREAHQWNQRYPYVEGDAESNFGLYGYNTKEGVKTNCKNCLSALGKQLVSSKEQQDLTVPVPIVKSPVTGEGMSMFVTETPAGVKKGLLFVVLEVQLSPDRQFKLDDVVKTVLNSSPKSEHASYGNSWVCVYPSIQGMLEDYMVDSDDKESIFYGRNAARENELEKEAEVEKKVNPVFEDDFSVVF